MKELLEEFLGKKLRNFMYREGVFGNREPHYQCVLEDDTDVIVNTGELWVFLLSYRTYNAREKKWDELTKSSGGNYIDGFEYDLISPYLVRQLISQFYYTGKSLYDHLAYKFDKVFFKEETKNEQSTGT